MLIDLQRQMLAACYGDAAGFAAVLPHLAPTGVAVDKALYIHTATVTAALTGVLTEAYPTVHRHLGDDAFTQAARVHLRGNPPGPAMLSAYGGGFAADLPTGLALAAGLDWAAHHAYFAADSGVMTAGDLSGLPPDALASLRLPLVPSASVHVGPFSSLDDWQAGRGDLARLPPPLPLVGPDAAALIWRGGDLLVTATLLPADAGAFVQALAGGADLLTAAGHLTDGDMLPPLLALLLGRGLVAARTEEMLPC